METNIGRYDQASAIDLFSMDPHVNRDGCQVKTHRNEHVCQQDRFAEVEYNKPTSSCKNMDKICKSGTRKVSTVSPDFYYMLRAAYALLVARKEFRDLPLPLFVFRNLASSLKLSSVT
jgi:hypothetical protein